MKYFGLLGVIAVFVPALAFAQSVAPIDTAAREAFVLEEVTGSTLYNKAGDERMTPSSMSKMMTVYLAFEALATGKLTLDQELTTSEHAWRQEGSRMFLNVGQKAKVEDLIRGVVIQSGNDAAVVFAEALGGSEENFANLMNAKGQELGLTGSHFANATGLPDPEHYSTAHDLARLAQALIRDFPDRYHYFSETNFTFNNISQGNRNPLLYRNMNVDGLKTGHTDDGGYGLTASAIRGGRRLILVLNGMTNMQMRADESAKLLDWAYREFEIYPITKSGTSVATAKVWLGASASVPLLASSNVTLSLARSARPTLKAQITYDEPVPAPITKGQRLGTLSVSTAGNPAQEIPLIAGADVPRLGFVDRIKVKINYLLGRS